MNMYTNEVATHGTIYTPGMLVDDRVLPCMVDAPNKQVLSVLDEIEAVAVLLRDLRSELRSTQAVIDDLEDDVLRAQLREIGFSDQEISELSGARCD
jgi:hypothetical protein